MARWVPFLALTAVTVGFVLAVARRSTALLRESTVDEAVPVPAEPTPAHPGVGEEPAAGSADRKAGLELTTRALLANTVATQGILAAIVVGAVVYFDIPQAAIGLGAGQWVWGLDALGLGLAFGVALWLASEAAGRLAAEAGFTYDERLRGLLAPTTIPGWVALFAIVLPIVAVAEELLFRAALVGVPAAAIDLSPWLFVVVSSAAFALGHGAQGRLGIAATGVLGLVLAAAFVLTESLVVVVLAHYVVNALEFGVHELVGGD